MGIFDWLRQKRQGPWGRLAGGKRRRVWAKYGKAHIELPVLGEDEYDDFSTALMGALEELEGVYWARANGVLGRMVVAFDEALVGLGDLLVIFDDVEARFGLLEADYGVRHQEHPGDEEAITRHVVSMGADLVGAGVGFFRSFWRIKRGRRASDLASFFSVVENALHIRGALAQTFGYPALEVALGWTNPVVQGWGSGPLTPLVDMGYQLCKLREALARKSCWEWREPELCAHPEDVEAPQTSAGARPVEIPEGPIERYSGDAWNISLGGFVVGLAETQKLQRAVTPLLDGLPKPARHGRGAFSSALGTVLSRRGMLVMDERALQRLDRIDCVIVDERLLITNRCELAQILVAPGVDPVGVYERAEALFEPHEPEIKREEGDYLLRPARAEELRQSWVEQEFLEEAGDKLALLKEGELQGLFSLAMVADQGSEALIEAIREADLELILATEYPGRSRSFRPDRVVDPDEELTAFIREIQRDFQVVALLWAGPERGLLAADLSVGFCAEGGQIPWGADLIAGDELRDGVLLIQALQIARKVSQDCALLAGAGAAIGAFSAIGGLKRGHPWRVMVAVNMASALALIYGTIRGEGLARAEVVTRAAPKPWHRMELETIYEELRSGPGGLSEREAGERRREPPELPSKRQRFLRAIAKELANPLTPVLGGGAAVAAVVGSAVDAAIVGVVIAVNGLMGGVERFQAEEAMAKMARRDIFDARVRRDGELRVVPDEEVVIGDIVAFEAGDLVPADCRILEAQGLEVDESSLTGESLPVGKSEEPSFSREVAERSSMLYQGTAIASGAGEAIVVATGEASEAQRALYLSGHQRERRQGVEERLTNLTELSLPLASLSGGVLMSLGVLRRQELKTLVGPAVNLAIGAVPEGLPLLATTAQLAASRRLSRRQVLVNNPRVMEALGRVDVLCIDKTGTLTEGRLSLHSVFDGESVAGLKELRGSHREVLQGALRASPGPAEDGQVLLHATDQVILDSAAEIGVEVGEWAREEELPFKSELGLHAVMGVDERGPRIMLKGSPEKLLPRCVLHEARAEELREIGRDLAGQGLRILAVASRGLSELSEELGEGDLEELQFEGFIALSDPIREAAPGAVEVLGAAGVSVIMITGDHGHTARRIARDIGLAHQDEGALLEGPQIEVMSDDELEQALLDVVVIARATPAHKVRIVQALQRQEKTVAMTGDGANDAAAIRLADVGIALGQQSSPAARDAADLVVVDARMETIVDAVVEGRALWRSVRDAVSILVGGNIGEVFFMLASGVLSRAPALNARQLLLVNLFTDVAPALAIALRPPPEASPAELLHEGPEESLGRALEREILFRAAFSGGAAFLAWMVARYSFQRRRASTISLLAVVAGQLGQTLTMGKPTKPVWIASVGTLVLLLGIIETPGVSHVLGCRPLGPVGLTTAFSAAAVATAASLVVPEIPGWTRRLRDVLPGRAEPGPQDFFDNFYAFEAPYL